MDRQGGRHPQAGSESCQKRCKTSRTQRAGLFPALQNSPRHSRASMEMAQRTKLANFATSGKSCSLLSRPGSWNCSSGYRHAIEGADQGCSRDELSPPNLFVERQMPSRIALTGIGMGHEQPWRGSFGRGRHKVLTLFRW